MGTRKLAFLIFFFFAFSASHSFNIMVSASMHEGVLHEKSVKLSIAGSAREGFSGGDGRSLASSGGGRGGTVGSGGRGVNGGKQSPTGGGSFIPVYAAGGAGAAAAAHGNQHHGSNATNCPFSSMLTVIIWATIMASICLRF